MLFQSSGEETSVSIKQPLGGHESVQGTRHQLLITVHGGEWQKIKVEKTG